MCHDFTLRWMPDQSLNCSTISRSETISSIVLVTIVSSSAYHLLASRRPRDVISYPFCEALSHRMRGLIIRSNNNGEGESPCRVPRLRPMGGMWPWVTSSAVAPLYRFVIIVMKSCGSPRNSRVLTRWSWSAEGKAPLKSRRLRCIDRVA